MDESILVYKYFTMAMLPCEQRKELFYQIIFSSTAMFPCEQRKELTMLDISSKTNLLEQKDYSYELQDVQEPKLYRDMYSYEEIPKIVWNHRKVPMNMPDDIWITDTTFRDGMQS